MDGKATSSITEIIVDDATFHNRTIEPTFINFFYGKNGAGKSTIANAIKPIETDPKPPEAIPFGLSLPSAPDNKPTTNSKVIFRNNMIRDDFNILLYNQDFVRKNIRDDAELPGVFTIKQSDIDKKDLIDAKVKQLSTLSDERIAKEKTMNEKNDESKQLVLDFRDECFSVTKDIREAFDATQAGKKRNREAFVNEILNAPAKQQNLDELKKLYEVAYDKSITSLNPLQKPATYSPKDQPGYELLNTAIVSTADTPFSNFLTKIKAADWVAQGHNRFASSYGQTCPYCQQPLPDNFEEMLAQCFDSSYQDSLNLLGSFVDNYRSSTDSIIASLRRNDIAQLPGTFDMQEYLDLIDYLEKTRDTNMMKMENKLNSPTTKIEIDDISPTLDRINGIIDSANKRISEINEVVKDKRNKRDECSSMVWQHMHYVLEDVIKKFFDKKKQLNQEAIDIETEIKKIDEDSENLQDEIRFLSSQISNVKETIDGINTLLKESGFQGFRIREAKPKPANIVKADGSIDTRILVPVDGIKTYEIERPTGETAHGLSEGERNFIAFLYFYHTVKGSLSEEGDLKEKIVVIDDPVTSMDSSSMFIVSSLIREMIDNCYATHTLIGYDDLKYHIHQIFLMTHNAYFHKEITYGQTAPERYKAVTFFHVKKPMLDSTVVPCIKRDPYSETPSRPFNHNPVKNSYAALWDEYKEVETAIPALNVIRRILEYYFIQLCGYDRYELSEKILRKNMNRFVKNPGKPDEDSSQLTIANSMLQYLTSSSFSPNDDMYSLEDSWELSQIQEIFKIIFDIMDQNQHFKAMTENK